MRLLGISAFYHDSAAALIEDGRIVAAAQEERFTRKKHDPGFPAHAIRYCLRGRRHQSRRRRPRRLLREAAHQVRAPAGNLSRQRAARLPLVPAGDAAVAQGEAVPEAEPREGAGRVRPRPTSSGKLLFAEHHLSHAASAFFASPFEEAVVLTLDGVGEWATASVSIGRGNRLEVKREIHWPHRSACSTRPSPTTPASRSTRASTS